MEADCEAPEDVSLAEGRRESLARLKEESARARKVREEGRERRRQRNEQFRRQKAAGRLKRLSKETLREAVLKADSEREGSSPQGQQPKHTARRRQRGGQPLRGAQLAQRVSRGSFSVVALGEEEEKAVVGSYELVREYLHRQLYGGRQTRAAVFRSVKQSQHCRPAMDFTS